MKEVYEFINVFWKTIKPFSGVITDADEWGKLKETCEALNICYSKEPIMYEFVKSVSIAFLVFQERRMKEAKNDR